MKLTKADIRWLADWYPALGYDPSTRMLNGELDFCADYDRQTRAFVIGTSISHVAVTESTAHIDDVFEIEIDLVPQVDYGTAADPSIHNRIRGTQFIPAARVWPRVVETGGRCSAIARKRGVRPIDLHLFENGACCLAVKPAAPQRLRIAEFMHELVVPFFYRVAYVERFGLAAAQNDLWGERSHYLQGIIEYENEMREIAAQAPSPSDACPCGRGRRFSDCCQAEIDIVVPRHPAMRSCAAGRERMLKTLEPVDRDWWPLWMARA